MKDLRGYWFVVRFERVPEWVAAVINWFIDGAIALGLVVEDYENETAF